MEEVINLNQEDVINLVSEFNLEPRGRDVIITVNTVQEEDENGVILSDNSFSDEQYVIAVGDHVRDLQPGQKVLLNLEAMMSRTSVVEDVYETQTQIKIFPVKYKDRMFALVGDNIIKIKINN